MSKDKQTIAPKTLVVYDPALGFDRQVVAGQPVPPDLVEAYNAKLDEADEVEAPATASVSTAPGGTSVPPEPEPDPAPLSVDDDSITRDQLNAIAGQVGVEEPDKLPNKGAVVDAIKEKPADEVAAAIKAIVSDAS